ncbi:MAG: imidazole glycerol phosphate synthase subunit HisF [Rhodospirillales bacterium CG15_BIG_FIL_POST_REV_8_21_14_020_66_15]|nr:MAG: imidazole glycerol phosphate synthase subunit HisF [Rhodospirillales bacterium CG15_BIG_FIL_POST_REV_8_21_14_020_66_15]
MNWPRVIPVLLLRGRGLYKTVKFKDPVYVGDPMNTVRLFNEKEANELVVLDIGATAEGRGPNFDFLEDLASECFMPFAYGGGITSVEQIKKLFFLGAEKAVINAQAFDRPGLIDEAARLFGSQSVVVSIDAKRRMLGAYDVCTHNGTKARRRRPAEFAREMESRGAGEILINAIDRDGTMTGYDLELVREVSEAVSVPVVACGGAGRPQDFRAAVAAGAAAVSAGAYFVFQGKHRAVLVSYPSEDELRAIFSPEQ